MATWWVKGHVGSSDSVTTSQHIFPSVWCDIQRGLRVPGLRSPVRKWALYSPLSHGVLPLAFFLSLS